VVLDRHTLEQVRNESYANDTSGAAKLESAVKGLPGSDLVIITKPNENLTNSNPDQGDMTAAASINGALAAIGVAEVPANVSTQRLCTARRRLPGLRSR
jgi:hypothetical protein